MPSPAVKSISVKSRRQPSFKHGFAKSAAESAHPELWEGMLCAYIPGLGQVGDTLKNWGIAPGGDMVLQTAGPTWVRTEGRTSLSFDGGGDEIYKTADDFLQDDFDQFTILSRTFVDAWPGAGFGIFGRNEDGGDGDFTLNSDTSGAGYRFSINGVTSTANVDANRAGTMSGSWETVAGIQKASDHHEIWLDGIFEAQQTIDRGSIAASGTNAWQLGAARLLEWVDVIGECYFWNRVLSPSELKLLHDDPLAPFRKKLVIPGSGETDPPTGAETFNTVSVTSHRQPSYKHGFAKSTSESAHPELWEGLVGAWVPALGNVGIATIQDIVRANSGTFNNVLSTDWQIENGFQVLDFDGSTSYIDGTSPLLTYSSNMSLFAVAKCNDTFPGDDYILSISDPSASNRFAAIEFDRTSGLNRWRFTSIVNSGGANIAEGTDTDLPFNYASGTYYSVCGTVQANLMRLYVDGVLGATTDTQPTPTATPTEFQIGRMINTFDSGYGNVSVAIALIFDRALTQPEIQLLTADPLAPFRKKLIIPGFGDSIPTPEPEKATAFGTIKTSTPQRTQPSIKHGYAKSAGESARPDLWTSLKGAYLPQLGVSNVVHNIAGGENGTINGALISWANAPAGLDIDSGSAQYMGLANPPIDQDSDEFTVVIKYLYQAEHGSGDQFGWAVWEDGTGTGRVLIGYKDDAGSNGFYTFIDGSHEYFATGYRPIEPGDPDPFIAVIRKRGTSFSMWCNGEFLETITLTADVNSAPMRFGSSKNGGDNSDTIFYGALIYDAAISDADCLALSDDILTPFRRKLVIPGFGDSIPTPAPEKTDTFKITTITSHRDPSYKHGYAKSAAESANPNLWRGLVRAWVPALGNTGAVVRDVCGLGDVTLDPAQSIWEAGYIEHAGLEDSTQFSPIVATAAEMPIWTVVSDCNRKSTGDVAADGGLIGRGVSNNASIGWTRASGWQVIRGEGSGVNLRHDWGVAADIQDQWRLWSWRGSDNTAVRYGRDDQFRDFTPGVSNDVADSNIRWDQLDRLFEVGPSATSEADVAWRSILIYDRWLTDSEIEQLHQDPLAPFRQKLYIPAFGDPIPTPEPERTDTFKTTVITSHRTPSYKQGFAKSAANSAHPDLWKGLRNAYLPSLGVTGDVIRDTSGLFESAVWNGTGSHWEPGYASFNGTDDSATSPDGLNPNIAGLTMVCRIRFPDITAGVANTYYGFFATHAHNSTAISNNTVYLGARHRTGELRLGMLRESGGANESLSVSSGVWHTLVGYDHGDDGTTDFWLNGVPISLNLATGRSVGNTSYNITLGAGHEDGTPDFVNLEISEAYIYDRKLSPTEIGIISADSLAPFRKKLYIPAFGDPIPTPEPERTDTFKTTVIPSHRQPSYKHGFAKHEGEAAYPNLRGSLVANYLSLGSTGGELVNPITGTRGDLTNMEPSSDWLQTPYGSGLAFGGTDEYATSGDFGLDFDTADFSVSFWMRDDGSNAWASFISNNANVWEVGITSGDDRIHFQFSGSIRNYGEFVGDDEWHHIVLRRTGTTVSHYVDGVLGVWNREDGAPASLGTTSDPLILGARTPGIDLWWIGQLASVNIFDRLLTPHEITLLYRDPLAPFRKKLYIPAFGDPIPEVAPEKATAFGTVKTNLIQRTRPSYKHGFAKSAGESAYPELWTNLVALWVPALGSVYAPGAGSVGKVPELIRQLTPTTFSNGLNYVADYIDCNNSKITYTHDPDFSLSTSRDFTAFAYVQPNAGGIMFGKGDFDDWYMSFQSGNDRLRCFTFAPFTEIENTPNDSMTIGDWHGCFLVHEGAAGIVTSSVDGIHESTSAPDLTETAAGVGEMALMGKGSSSGINGYGKVFGIWHRKLSQAERQLLGADPLALLRKKIIIPGFGDSITPPDPEKATAFNTITTVSHRAPSFKHGYAKNAAESANPDLWNGLVRAYAPALGATGSRLVDFVNSNHATIDLDHQQFEADYLKVRNTSAGNTSVSFTADEIGDTFTVLTFNEVLSGGGTFNSGLFGYSGDNKNKIGWEQGNGRQSLAGDNYTAVYYDWGSSSDIETGKPELWSYRWVDSTKAILGKGAQFRSPVAEPDVAFNWTQANVLFEKQASYDFPQNVRTILVYNRWLSDAEINRFVDDPLAPFRQKLIIPAFGDSIPIPEPEKATAFGTIITHVPQKTQPSFKHGYAKSAAESAHPKLWDGLKIAWSPTLGHQGQRLVNLAGGEAGDIVFDSALTNSAWQQGENGLYLVGGGGTDERLVTTDAPYQGSFNETFSIFAKWRKPTHSTFDGVFCRGSNNSNGAISLRCLGTANDFSFWCNGGSGNSEATVVDASLFDGNWHTGCGVSYSRYLKSLFVDGIKRATDNTDIFSSNVTAPPMEWEILALANAYWDGDVAECMFWDRALTNDEIALLDVDPLAPFRKRIVIPGFGDSIPTPEPEKATAFGTVKTDRAQQSQPSYKHGFAKSAAESAYPELWTGLVGAWVPYLGETGSTILDASGHNNNGVLVGGSWITTQYGPAIDYPAIPTNHIAIDTPTIKQLDDWTIATDYRTPSNINWDSASLFDLNGSLTANNDYLRISHVGASTTSTPQLSVRRSDGGFESDQIVADASVVPNTYYRYLGRLKDTTLNFWINNVLQAATATHEAYTNVALDVTIGDSFSRTGGSNDTDGPIGYTLLWDRGLSDKEVAIINTDPLAPFRKKIVIPGFGDPLPTPDPEKATAFGIIKTHVPQRTQPSYKHGFAKNAGESAYPKLWDDLILAWVPQLGITGEILRDIGGHHDATFAGTTNPLWSLDSVRGGAASLEFNGSDNKHVVSSVTDGPRDNLTVATWFRVTNRYNTRTVFVAGHSDTINSLVIRYNDVADTLIFEVRTSGGSNSISVAEEDWNDDVWNLAVLRFSKGTIDAYVRSDEQGIGTATGTTIGDDLVVAYTDAILGVFEDKTTGDFSGNIATCLFYRRVLSDAEIEDLFLDPLAPFRKKLIIPGFGDPAIGASVTHTTDTTLSEAQFTQTTDALLQAEETFVHTTDAAISEADFAHTTDALLAAESTFAHTTDAALSEADFAYTTDALLQAEETFAHTTDAALSEADFVHTTDAALSEATFVHTTDAALSEADFAHATDAALVKTEFDHTTDALLLAEETFAHTTDAALSEADFAYTTDALLATESTFAYTTDAALSEADFAHTTDAALSEADFAYTTDALLVSGVTVVHTTDTALSEADFAYTTDALLQAEETFSYSTDAALSEADFIQTVDALLASEASFVQTVDAALSEADFAHDTDALLQAEVSTTYTTDAALSEADFAHTTDVLLQAEFNFIYTTNSLLQAEFSVTQFTDALLAVEISVTHTTDAHLAIEANFSYTSDSLLNKETNFTHTTDALILGQITHGTNSKLSPFEGSAILRRRIEGM